MISFRVEEEMIGMSRGELDRECGFWSRELILLFLGCGDLDVVDAKAIHPLFFIFQPPSPIINNKQ